MHPLYTIKGEVKHGAKRGRDFGYPTANVSIQSYIPEGVYAANVIVDDKTYIAATFIGSAPTFGDAEYKSESYILDFDDTIYGKTITINLFTQIRGRETFVNEHALKKQMEKDVEKVKLYFRRNT